jgi:KTSC domain
MESVQSGNVSEIGYDPDERTLYVRFRSGPEYRYHEVPKNVYDALREATNIGKHLFHNISGIYPFSSDINRIVRDR